MRILFLLTQDLESPSGLGRYLPLTQELVHLGHQVIVAALHADFEQLKDKTQNLNGVEVHYLAQMHVRKRDNRKYYFSPAKLMFLAVWATIKMAWFTIRHPADLVCVGKPHPMNSLGGWIGSFFGIRRLWLDCDDYEAGVNRFSGRWQLQVIRFFEDWMPHRADFITTNTHFTEKRLLKIGIPASKIWYMPNGVQPARFPQTPPEKLDALRSELRLHDKKVAVYVGSLSLTGHPVDLLVQAFAKVHRNCPDSVLLLVGGGEDFDTLQALAAELGVKDAVVFTGRVSPNEVAMYYQVGDVSVDPVYDDDVARGRSPLKLFESWACGVPFVTADVGDRQELMGQPPAGLLSHAGDVESLSEAICLVLADADIRVRLQKQGFTRVKYFNWDYLTCELDSFCLRSQQRN